LIAADLNDAAAIIALEEMIDDQGKLAGSHRSVPRHLDAAIRAAWGFQMLDRTL
jgi:hypothetical protein